MKCVDDQSKPEDFRRPGHVFPLIARNGGVLVRNGHTEATIDLMRLAGLKECGVCCEIMKEDGTMMRTENSGSWRKSMTLNLLRSGSAGLSAESMKNMSKRKRVQRSQPSMEILKFMVM